MAIKRILRLGAMRVRLCISSCKSDFYSENMRYGLPACATGACGYVQPIDRNMVLVCVFRYKSAEKLRSVIFHESIHVAHFYVEVHLGKRIPKCTPRNGFYELMAYAAQEIAWKVERVAFGTRRVQFPFAPQPGQRPKYL